MSKFYLFLYHESDGPISETMDTKQEVADYLSNMSQESEVVCLVYGDLVDFTETPVKITRLYNIGGDIVAADKNEDMAEQAGEGEDQLDLPFDNGYFEAPPEDAEDDEDDEAAMDDPGFLEDSLPQEAEKQ